MDLYTMKLLSWQRRGVKIIIMRVIIFLILVTSCGEADGPREAVGILFFDPLI
jgi:hypothetical protein